MLQVCPLHNGKYRDSAHILNRVVLFDFEIQKVTSSNFSESNISLLEFQITRIRRTALVNSSDYDCSSLFSVDCLTE